MSERIPDVLASRYASADMRAIWSEKGKIAFERRLWIAILRGQRDLGVDVPPEAIEAYERVVDHIDLESIRRREAVTKHDVKARIEEFCALAGHEHIHKGMTSRDLTDNVEQMQVHRSLNLVQVKFVSLLGRLSDRAREWKDLVVVGRTHHAAAQPTTMGKRIAMFGEEMLLAFGHLDELVRSYPLRGVQGAVGTAVDQLTLFDGAEEKVMAMQQRVLAHLGLERQLNAVGQIYPRSLDYEVASCLYQLGGGVANAARTLRLLAGADAATEGFAEGQVGSTAMPHKMNTRSAERINSLHVVVGGYAHMLGSLVGDQWFEGDVSCSAVRRVALPGSFFAFDGIVETMYHVLDDMHLYTSALENELQRYLPFLATTTLLMESVRRGAGREQAHEALKQHSVAAAIDMREKGVSHGDLAQRLAADERLPFTRAELDEILGSGHSFVGMAPAQAERFVAQVTELQARFPDSRDIQKGPLL